MVNRRAFLAASAAAAVGCSRQRATRYFGWLFIASASEKALAVADLSEFHRVATIPLGQAPAQVFRVGRKVFVTCPDGHVLYEINPETFRIAGKILFPGRIATAAVRPDETQIAVAIEQPAAVHLVDPATRGTTKRIALPGVPKLLDLTDGMAAVSLAGSSGVIRLAIDSGKIAGTTELGMHPGILRLHGDARLMLVGASDRGEIVTVSTDSGAILARMPLAFVPARFCFKSDMGQMFVTGFSSDELAIVSPYQSEVDQTIVAGRTPFGMTVGAMNGLELLFVTNPGSGDLTIFDIEQRRLMASVHVGSKPGEVLLTPDNEYALVVNQESGDVSVVRVKTALDKKNKVKPLFTVFPTGADPQSAAIVPEGRQG